MDELSDRYIYQNSVIGILISDAILSNVLRHINY